MPTVSITVGAAFATAIQEEAALLGLAPQDWAKQVIKAEILNLRLEREQATQDVTYRNALRVASDSAEATRDNAIEAVRSQLSELT